ncbi:hypothetical protein TNCV_4695121 [Trichonephila clavipes]|nr:hypothetical protein TNCV_4695121 [Trichonephila clavipes]
MEPLLTEASMGGRKGSTRNGSRDPKCPSARRLRTVQEDTGAPSEAPIQKLNYVVSRINFSLLYYEHQEADKINNRTNDILAQSVEKPTSRKSSREVDGRGREVEDPDPHSQNVIPLNWDGTVLSPVWCSRLRPTIGVHLSPCHHEFHGPRSDTVGIRLTPMRMQSSVLYGQRSSSKHMLYDRTPNNQQINCSAFYGNIRDVLHVLKIVSINGLWCRHHLVVVESINVA